MRRGPDIPSLVAGLVLIALGGVLLADSAGAIELDFAALGVEGRAALIRVAAAGRPNDVLARPTVAGGRVSFVQPPASAVLVAVERGIDDGSPTGLRLEPLPEAVGRNRVRQLTALATFADGSERDVSDRVTWQSEDPTTVRVNSSGLAVGVGVGTADVRACWAESCSEPLSVAVQ